jgi:hypothetical protein
VAARGLDETPGDKAPQEPEAKGDRGRGGEVFDLWSLPPGALSLDGALLGDEEALDRLAAVLPILDDAEPEPPTFPPPAQDYEAARYRGAVPRPTPATDPLPGVRGERLRRGQVPRPDAHRRPGAEDRGLQRSGREAESAGLSRVRRGERARSRGGARHLSLGVFLALLLAVYAASVAAMIGFQVVYGQGQGSTGRPGGRIVIDGPLPCPMYRAPQSAEAASDGTCFFVG